MKSYDLNQHKEYYRDVVELFRQFIYSQGYQNEQHEKVKVHEEKNFLEPFQPITDWLKLFLQMMNDGKLTGQLRKKLKPIVKDDFSSEGLMFANLIKQHSRWVRWNKNRTRRDFLVEA